MEPPGPSRIERIVGAARAASEQQFCAHTVARLPTGAVSHLEELPQNQMTRARALSSPRVNAASWPN